MPFESGPRVIRFTSDLNVTHFVEKHHAKASLSHFTIIHSKSSFRP
jgi:hypothetical protein